MTGSVAELLGFSRVAYNSIDAVSDRDFAIEFLSMRDNYDAPVEAFRGACALVNRGIFIYRASGWIYYGSSIMPRKEP